ncbi:biopolymer transporter ExbD [Candidatus Aerophobetes bacterium]|uniref:Biopolymer transporter ExbD n=1 Tax=Aerophobetes bacterium TaxID=2030807 RepID=A0A662D3K1_UNCAE|nr:MAG: biopolymer transporter ExbD [Candidatus Aerophobetes bacterium]
MRFRRPKARKEAAFDLTPLIDVVFLLLIFFMVSTTFATIRHGIKVNLPTTTTPQERIEKSITISITKDNQIYIGKKWVKKENLVALLRKELKGEGGLVVINADRDTLHGKVVEVMDLAKQAGASKLGILTIPEVGRKK